MYCVRFRTFSPRVHVPYGSVGFSSSQEICLVHTKTTADQIVELLTKVNNKFLADLNATRINYEEENPKPKLKQLLEIDLPKYPEVPEHLKILSREERMNHPEMKIHILQCQLVSEKRKLITRTDPNYTNPSQVLDKKLKLWQGAKDSFLNSFSRNWKEHLFFKGKFSNLRSIFNSSIKGKNVEFEVEKTNFYLFPTQN